MDKSINYLRTGVRRHITMGHVIALLLLLPSSATGLTFEKALRIAYDNNPTLQVQIAQAKAANGQLIQSHRYLNPALSLTTENIGGSGDFNGFESAETTLSVTQPIPLGGQWQSRQKAANAQFSAMKAAIARKQSQLYVEVGTAYIDVFYDRKWYAMTTRLVHLNESIVNNVERLIHSGAGKQLDLQFAKIDLYNERILQSQAKRDMKRSQSRLAQLLGYRCDKQFELNKHSTPNAFLDWHTIKQRISNSARITEKQQLVQARRMNITAAQKKVWPILSLSLGARHFSDDSSNALVVSAASALPVYNRNEGNIASAQANYTQSLQALRAQQLSLEQTLYGHYLRLVQKKQEADIVSNQLLPMAQKAQKTAQLGYDKGLYTFADLTLAMRRLIKEQRHYIEAHSKFENANVHIHGLLYHPIKQG